MEGETKSCFTISTAGLSTRPRFLSGLRGWNTWTKRNTLFYGCLCPARSLFQGTQGCRPAALFTDNKFQIKASALTNRAVNRKIGFTEPIVKQSGDDLLINPKLNDTIYRLDGRSLKPLYYVDKSALGPVLPTEDLTDEQIIELDKKPLFSGVVLHLGRNFYF